MQAACATDVYKRQAESMIAYLAGEEIPVAEPYLVEQEGLTSEDFAQETKIPRVKMPHLAPDVRITNFREVNLGLPDEEAVKEAGRCLESVSYTHLPSK